jgi:hypothetical protein
LKGKLKKSFIKEYNSEINSKLLDILEKTNERAEKYPISLEGITEEVKYIRRKRYEKN